MSLAAFIADQRTSHHVPHAVACRALTVSESWFYKWNFRQRQQTPTPAEQRRAEVDAAVAEAFEAAHGLHGSPRVHADSRAAGWVVSEKDGGEDGGKVDGPPRPGRPSEEAAKESDSAG